LPELYPVFHFKMTNEALGEINHIESLKGMKLLIYDSNATEV